jgi:uncharacterized protein
MAIDVGDLTALTNLGWLYANGKGVQDYDKAREFYQKAADAGEPSGMTNLGGLYRDGNGVAQVKRASGSKRVPPPA